MALSYSPAMKVVSVEKLLLDLLPGFGQFLDFFSLCSLGATGIKLWICSFSLQGVHLIKKVTHCLLYSTRVYSSGSGSVRQDEVNANGRRQHANAAMLVFNRCKQVLPS